MNLSKIGLFLLGKKGWAVLFRIIAERSACISYVVGARDAGVDHDYFEEIQELCKRQEILFIDRKEIEKFDFPSVDYKFCIGWRWILNGDNNLIVFHDSLLPKYRGFAPLVNMLINGERKIGVTALKASDDYDKGDVYMSNSIDIDYPIKISEAIDKIIPVYEGLVLNIISKINQGKLESTAQDDSLSTYSMWRDENDYFIDWNKDANWIVRFCNAVSSPYQGAQTYVHGSHVRIEDCCVIEDVFIESRDSHVGKVIFWKNKFPVVICGSGLLMVKKMSSMNGECYSLKKFRVRFGDTN